MTSIRGEVLRHFLAEGAGRRISVILEARRPKLSHAQVRPVTGRLTRAYSQRENLNLQTARANALEAAMREIAAILDQLGLLQKARRYNLGGHFVVEVDQRELRTLAALASIQAIRPNVTRRRLPAAHTQS